MFQKTFLLILFTLLVSCKNDADTIEKITASKWVLGTWAETTADGTLEETWTSKNDSTFEGTSFFIKGKDTLHNEAIILQQIGEDLVYKATIQGENGDQTILFPLTVTTEKSVTFENKKHDYPQKIVYQLVNDSTMTLNIAGKQAGKPMSESYKLKKVN